MRILIVEDELAIAVRVEASLSEEGHQIVGVARESEIALTLGRRLKPDLALVDVHLVDGETGPEIGRHLKDMGVPVLFMTADPDKLPDGMAGALGVIPKPIADHVLKGAIQWVNDRDADPPDTLILNR